jgi:S1-C subfamily serine protease
VEVNDVIVAVDGQAVRRADDVGAAIRGRRPGDTVRITVLRGGERRTLDVTLGSVPLSELG